MKIELKADARVEIRLCSPLGDENGQATGVDEMFVESLYQSGQKVLVALCSPWIDVSAIERISELCAGCTDKSVVFRILTFRAHMQDHENALIRKFRMIRNKPFTDSFIVGRLPAKENPKELRDDILHAKIYAVAYGRGGTGENSGRVVEAFFGSANFTGAGIGSSREGASRKFEIVARVKDDDQRGKEAVMKAFHKLWYVCDKQELGTIEKEDVFYERYKKRKRGGP